MYFMITNCDPDSVWACHEKEDILLEAREYVQQQMNDHWRHELPEYPTDEFVRFMGIKVYETTTIGCVEVRLPLQTWLEEYRDGLQEMEEKDEFKKRYVATVIEGMRLYKQQADTDRDFFPLPQFLDFNEIDQAIKKLEERGFV